MKIYINDRAMEVLPGMTVRHVLLRAGLLQDVEGSKRVYDEWGNEVGLEGGLSEGMKLEVK